MNSPGDVERLSTGEPRGWHRTAVEAVGTGTERTARVNCAAAYTDEPAVEAGGNTRYGRAGLEAELIDLGVSLQTRGVRHAAIVKTTWHLAGLVKGQQLAERYTATAAENLIRGLAPDRLGDFHRAWASALRKAPARYPAIRDAYRPGSERSERLPLIAEWLDRGPCSDPALALGKTKGANAFAVCVYFAAAASTAGTTFIRESFTDIGARLCVGPATAWRTMPLWLPWVQLVEKGRAQREGPNLRSVYRLRDELTRTEPKSQYEMIPGLAPPANEVHFTSGHPFVQIDLGNPLHLPHAERWVRRRGGRQEWRIWLALDEIGGFTTAEIGARAGLHRHQVTEVLRRMMTAGEVTEPEPGRFTRSLGQSIYDDPAFRGVQGCVVCRPGVTRWRAS